MNTSLREQQQWLAAAIVGGDVVPEFDGLLCKTPQGDAPRIDIYRNAYRARLAAALKENFSVLHRVLGDDAFRELAEIFIAARPSREPSIRWFGAELPDFLSQHPDLAPHPALGDLSRMEWALSTAFDAADAALLEVSSLLAVTPTDWPTLRFTAHPSLQLVPLSWAVEPLWSTLSVDENAATEPPEPLAHHLLVWRGGAQTHWRSVADIEAKLLAACIAGRPFAELCELAADAVDERAATEVAGYLRAWVEAGLLADTFMKT